MAGNRIVPTRERGNELKKAKKREAQ